MGMGRERVEKGREGKEGGKVGAGKAMQKGREEGKVKNIWRALRRGSRKSTLVQASQASSTSGIASIATTSL